MSSVWGYFQQVKKEKRDAWLHEERLDFVCLLSCYLHFIIQEDKAKLQQESSSWLFCIILQASYEVEKKRKL